MFEDLYELLSRYKVDTPDRFYGISDSNRKALSGRVAVYFRDNLPHILDLIEASQGLVFNFNEYSPRMNSLQAVTRKAVFYSDVSVALLDSSVTLAGAPAPVDNRGRGRRMQRKTYATNMGGLVETLLQIRPLVQKGILIPLPGQLSASAEVMGQYNAVLESIRSGRTRGIVIPVTLDRWAIRRQIEELERSHHVLRDVRPVQIYLPHLRGLDGDTLLGLREDNYDAFLQFQRALREFATRSAVVSSETAFLDIARKVDSEVRLLEERLKSLERARRNKGYEVMLGLAVSSLTLLVSRELAAALAAIVGKASIYDGIKYLRSEESVVASSEYHMAYLVKKAQDELLSQRAGPLQL